MIKVDPKENRRLVRLLKADRTKLDKDVAYLLDRIEFNARVEAEQVSELRNNVSALEEALEDANQTISLLKETIRVLREIIQKQTKVMPREMVEDEQFKKQLKALMDFPIRDTQD